MTATRLALTVTLIISLLDAPTRGYAEQAAKIFRIGYLSSGGLADTAPRFNAFRQALRDLAYVEGRTVVIESRWAEGLTERVPSLAAELVRLKVDVIVARAPDRPTCPSSSRPSSSWWSISRRRDRSG